MSSQVLAEDGLSPEDTLPIAQHPVRRFRLLAIQHDHFPVPDGCLPPHNLPNIGMSALT